MDKIFKKQPINLKMIKLNKIKAQIEKDVFVIGKVVEFLLGT